MISELQKFDFIPKGAQVTITSSEPQTWKCNYCGKKCVIREATPRDKIAPQTPIHKGKVICCTDQLKLRKIDDVMNSPGDYI